MRALQQLRERLDRRYEGRSAWQAVFLPCLREWAEPATQATRWWLAAGALLALLGGAWLWRTLPAGSASDPELASLPAAGSAASGGAGAEEPRVETGRAPVLASVPGTPAPRAPLELSLRDLHTGEPVPFFAIEVRAHRRLERARGQRRRGRAALRARLPVRSARPLPARRSRAGGLARAPARLARRALARAVESPGRAPPGGGRRVLELDIGPTYRIDLGGEALPELEDGLALLVRAARAGPGQRDRGSTAQRGRRLLGALLERGAHAARARELAARAAPAGAPGARGREHARRPRAGELAPGVVPGRRAGAARARP
jgi:hypothetical protein